MREYYIRREGDEDASGPFDIDQISSLIEADKLDANAYFYDIESESWQLISSNEELMDTLFPKKRKLTLRTPEAEAEKKRLAKEEAARKAAEAKAAAEAGEGSAADADGATGESAEPEGETADAAGKPESEDTSQDSAPAPDEKPDKKKKGKGKVEEKEKLEVTRMLALAEGRADDPSGKSPREKQAAVAFYGLRLLALFFATSILAMAFIEKDLILTANAIAMAKSPYLVVAAFDIFALVTLLLQVTEVYPLLRFRAAIGAGLLTILFYASGDTLLLVSNLLLMLAIYFCSAIIKIRSLIACFVAGALGIAGYVFAFIAAL